VLFVATAPPLSLWALAPLAWTPLLLAIRGQSAWRACALGFLHGLATNLLAFYWLVPALSGTGGLSVVQSALGVVGLCALQGARSAALATLLVWLTSRRRWSLPLAAPFVVVLVEGTIPLVFPWSTANLTQGNVLWLQLVALGGTAAASFWLMLMSALAAEALSAQPRRLGWLLLAGGTCLVGTAVGYWRLAVIDDALAQPASSALKVGVVQGNVGAVAQRQVDAVSIHRSLALGLLEQQPGLDLLVWPETVVSSPTAPAVLSRMHRDVLTRDRSLGVRAARIDAPILLGLVLTEDVSPASPVPQISNAAVLFDRTGAVKGTYRKQALVPLTETALLPGTEGWLPPISHFRPGPPGQYLEFDGHRLGVSICYEDTKADLIRNSVVEGRAELLINLTSDSWFAGTQGPELHLMLARFRAVENGRFLLQVSNDGMTALVDPAARIVWMLPAERAATKVAAVPWLRGRTGYHAIGAWPIWLSALLILGMSGWSPRVRWALA